MYCSWDFRISGLLGPTQDGKEKIFGQTTPAWDRFYLANVHRQENTDRKEPFKGILNAFPKLDLPVVLPAHPRLLGILTKFLTRLEHQAQ